jgi:predicted phage-related endonuclease
MGGPRMIRHLAVYTPRDPGFIKPGSEQHSQMISPSKVAAILGLSRWESPRSLWLRMRGDIPPQAPKDAFDIGHDVEPYAANVWRRRNPGWLLSPGEVQFVVDPDHFGFPALATLDRRRVRGRARGVLQIKLARDLTDLEKFGGDLSGDCPPDYFAQVLAEMLFTGWTDVPGHLLALGPYYTDRIFEIAYDLDAQTEAAAMIEECRVFYESLSSDTPPPLDSSVATYEAIRAQHPEIERDVEVELDPELADEFLTATAGAKSAESSARLAKTRVLDAMKRAQYAKCGGALIARRQPSSRGSVALYAAKGAK